jgi:hypothetical protein
MGAISRLKTVCDILGTDIAAAAQTERWGGAGPVRLLLGGEDSPAETKRTHKDQRSAHFGFFVSLGSLASDCISRSCNNAAAAVRN